MNESVELQSYLDTLMERKVYERVVCEDGATVSIQAGVGTYSTPCDKNEGPFTHVEAGFPSVEPPASWRAYAEDPTDLLNTVYARLPWDCVEEFLNVHDGVKSGELPPAAEEP